MEIIIILLSCIGILYLSTQSMAEGLQWRCTWFTRLKMARILRLSGFCTSTGVLTKLLDELEPYIKEIANKNNEEEWVGIVDPRKIRLGSRKYYRYMGFLTVLPCTEGVVWTIVKKIRTVSKDQVHLLKDAVHEEAHDNSRPLQSIYDSTVLLLKGFCLIMEILWEKCWRSSSFWGFR